MILAARAIGQTESYLHRIGGAQAPPTAASARRIHTYKWRPPSLGRMGVGLVEQQGSASTSRSGSLRTVTGALPTMCRAHKRLGAPPAVRRPFASAATVIRSMEPSETRIAASPPCSFRPAGRCLPLRRQGCGRSELPRSFCAIDRLAPTAAMLSATSPQNEGSGRARSSFRSCAWAWRTRLGQVAAIASLFRPRRPATLQFAGRSALQSRPN